MELPNDLILEILSWLPAKAIYKVKSASKFFSATLSETYFSLKQSQNSLLNNDSCFFLQANICQRYSAITEFHTLPSEKSTSGVSENFLQFLKNYLSGRIMASSNGLTLCRSTKQSGETDLFICNPATQSWLPIPTPDHLKKYPDSDINIAFECNYKSLEDSDDFMIFLFEVPNEWSSSCYDLNYYSGKEDCYPFLKNKSPYFRPYIVAYNIEDGESRILRVPKEARRGSQDLTCKMGIYKWGKVISLDQSICLVRLRKCVFTIWVLTDYESNTWRRVLKVRVKAMGMMEKEPIIITGFTVMNGDCLVFATKKKVYGYGLTKENYMMLEEICDHGFDDFTVSFTSYSNTLRSCGNGAANLPLILQQ